MSEHDGGTIRHDEVEELLGAYALHAVDPDEAALVEAHLATCGRCRAEVDGHRAVAAHLALGGAPAPDQIWDRIAGAIGGEAPPPPLRLVIDHGPSAAPAAVPVPAPRPRMPFLAAAAAIVVALVASGFALGSRTGDDDGVEQSEAAVAAVAALQSPDALRADLVDDDGDYLAQVAVLPDGSGYVFAGGLPRLEDRIYQLWASDGDAIVSLGPMGSSPQIVSFHTEPLEYDQLMITEEDQPVERTTNPAVAAGQLA